MENISLTSYLDVARISLLQKISSKKRVFDLLGELLAKNLSNIQATQVTENLMARERLGTTALGEGVAIPHCRMENISQIRGAVIKLEHAVSFDAPDGMDVSLIYALLVPTEATDDHLKVLANLAEFLSSPQKREALRSCRSAQELLDTLTNISKHAA